jgi:chromosome segregation ATPase
LCTDGHACCRAQWQNVQEEEARHEAARQREAERMQDARSALADKRAALDAIRAEHQAAAAEVSEVAVHAWRPAAACVWLPSCSHVDA